MSDAIAHWDRLISLLKKQRKGSVPAHVVKETRERVHRFADECHRQRIPLHAPDFDDAAFKGLTFGSPPLPTPDDGPNEGQLDDYSEAEIPGLPSILYLHATLQLNSIHTAGEMLQAKLKVEQLWHAARARTKECRRILKLLRAREARWLLARQQGKPYVFRPQLAKDRKQIIPRRCGCGCGQWAKLRVNQAGHPTGANHFLGGHCQRYIAAILRVERGEKRREDLPELLRARLKWTHCKLCYGWIPSTDPLGHELEERVGLSCWRERRKVWWPYATRG